MGRHASILIAAALLLAAAPASADAVDDLLQGQERFALWNECRPMNLIVHHDNDAAYIGLTKEAIEITARSRLRAARLYSNDAVLLPAFGVIVDVVGAASSINVQYLKQVVDRATGSDGIAIIWNTGVIGTHGGDSNFVLSSVALYVDKFIDEYLRVNAEACD